MNTLFNHKAVLTIDLEDWFHSLEPDPGKWAKYGRRIEFGTKILLELLSLKKSSATFFILGDAAVNSPQLIKQISSEGHEIATHGFNHNFIYNQSKEEFRDDLRRSIVCLSDLTGQKIVSYRAPYFSITKKSTWAFEILAEEGIECDSSVFPVINHRYGIPGSRRLPYKIRDQLWEWPVTTCKTFLGNIPFSGGVYLRFLPVRLSKYFLWSLLKKNEPVLFYIHPWELDYEQPRFKKGSAFLRFRHYYGLDQTFEKLNAVLDNLQLISLSRGLKLIRGDV